MKYDFPDILGNQCALKYVVPCIGTIQFARLPIIRYFKIEKRMGKGH